MIDDRCFLPNNRSKIKLEEKGRSATFLNPEMANGIKAIRVDGCVEAEGRRADFAVERERRAVVVELKGVNVEDGANQVEKTAAQWIRELKRADHVAGLIVARQYPRSNSKIQLKQQKYAKAFGYPLHVVCSNAEFHFDSLFRFANPLKKA